MTTMMLALALIQGGETCTTPGTCHEACIMAIGNCAECRAEIPSRCDRYCRACAERLGRCFQCGRPRAASETCAAPGRCHTVCNRAIGRCAECRGDVPGSCNRYCRTCADRLGRCFQCGRPVQAAAAETCATPGGCHDGCDRAMGHCAQCGVDISGTCNRYCHACADQLGRCWKCGRPAAAPTPGVPAWLCPVPGACHEVCNRAIGRCGACGGSIPSSCDIYCASCAEALERCRQCGRSWRWVILGGQFTEESRALYAQLPGGGRVGPITGAPTPLPVGQVEINLLLARAPEGATWVLGEHHAPAPLDAVLPARAVVHSNESWGVEIRRGDSGVFVAPGAESEPLPIRPRDGGGQYRLVVWRDTNSNHVPDSSELAVRGDWLTFFDGRWTDAAGNAVPSPYVWSPW